MQSDTACRTPWLAVDTVPPILDEAIKNCSKVTDLVVAGQDVTDQFFLNLHPDVRVQTLGITDFVSALFLC